MHMSCGGVVHAVAVRCIFISWFWPTMTEQHPAPREYVIDPAIEAAEPEEENGEQSSNSNSPSKGKELSESGSKSPSQATADASASPPPPNAWQAILSPQHNAYYFYNTETHETTWANPLQPGPSSGSDPASSTIEPHASTSSSTNASHSQSPPPSAQPSASTSATASSSHYAALQAAALAAGIDPSLAYLDPSLVTGPAGGPAPNTFTAKFNARTGAFTAGDARDPSHLSEFEVSQRF
jgi:hypothetical protein